jgi:hypothetical protein
MSDRSDRVDGALGQVWCGRAGTLLGVAVVLDVVNQSMARYLSRGHGEAVVWLLVDLLLYAAVAKGGRGAWLVLGSLTAVGAVVFLIAGAGEPSGVALPRGLLFAVQLLLLFSPAVRMRVGLSRTGSVARGR